MPTIVKIRGFTVKVNIIEDGEGPHVHVVKGGREYRVRLLKSSAKLMTAGGRERVTEAEGRVAERIVRDNLKACWKAWKRWHQ